MLVPADDLVLAVNSGSSSLKVAAFTNHAGEETAVLTAAAEGIGRTSGRLRIHGADEKLILDESYTLPTPGRALGEIVKTLLRFSAARPVGVGHRVVHGGPHLLAHQLVTKEFLSELHTAVHFAPLHIPSSIALIEEAQQLLPDIPQYACFDTVFHANMADTSRHFPLPSAFYEKGIRRYGFHGLSYESVVYRLRDRLPRRLICAHLGNGASLAAIREGVSIDTSMGLTPTGGIPMATRSGDLDPGILFFLMRAGERDADALEKMLNRDAGLVALSGGESDMRALQKRAEHSDSLAALAIDSFCVAVKKCMGAYAAELGGLDLLVFTGGIGEHCDYVRERVCSRLEFLGIEKRANGSFSKTMIMPSEEELQIARHCRRMMQAG